MPRVVTSNHIHRSRIKKKKRLQESLKLLIVHGLVTACHHLKSQFPIHTEKETYTYYSTDTSIPIEE